MRDLFRISVLIVCLVFVVPASANDKTIIMGYKAIAKQPLIGDAEENTGLYQDLFSQAAAMIGYQLKIVRIPKKRLHFELAQGNVDFYPGSSYSQKRADYLYFLPNGLQTKEVLVSLLEQPEITDMSEAKGTLIVELGSSKLEWDQLYPSINIVQLGKLSLGTVIKGLKARRGDFYIADIEIVDHYKKQHQLNSYADIGIRIHHQAINKQFIPMNMGFSRRSKLFSEQPNSAFDPEKGVTLDNVTTLVEKRSIAYQFYQALEVMRKQGETQKLYEKYFK